VVEPDAEWRDVYAELGARYRARAHDERDPAHRN
jgi:hypothetical protein